MEEKDSSRPFGDYSITGGHVVTHEVVLADQFETVERRVDAYETRLDVSSSNDTRQRQLSVKNESNSTNGSKSDLSPTQELKEEPSWVPPETLSTENSKRKRRPSYFERPRVLKLAIHLIVCGCTYPWLRLFAFLGQQTTTVTAARAVVGVGTSVLSLLLGGFLTDIALRHFESLSEFFTQSWLSFINSNDKMYRLVDNDFI